jgi:hypothetical protein
MKKLITTIFLFFIFYSVSTGQYNSKVLVISGGVNYSRYLGSGDGNNYFSTERPGGQLEFTLNFGNWEWLLWGVSYYKSQNIVGNSTVPVTFWSPYYTEFIFFQQYKKNPMFWLIGYDYVRMKFPNTEKPDSHHNITVGAGWNLKLTNSLYLQFKLKPYLILDNSIGQKFGVNTIVNFHLGI